MTFVDMQVKWSVTLTDRLGPEILTVLEIKGQVLLRVRLHVKVPGWLLNLNALLTKKLPNFLSRLREETGGPLPRTPTRPRRRTKQHRCVQTSRAPFQSF